MLKSDFDQIRKIVREEVGNEAESVKDYLSSDISSSKLRLMEFLDELKDRIKNLEIRIGRMRNEDIDSGEDL